MLTSYRLLRMEPQTADIPNHPEVVGRLDVDPGPGWPPVVALFIDVGATPPDMVEALVRQVRDSLQGLFPPGRVLFIPRRGGSSGTELYRLEPEPGEA